MFIGSSVSRHPFITIILSLGSLIFVHGITMLAHDYINHTNPDQRILYAFDTGLENLEHAYAKLFGGHTLIKSYNHDIQERSTEIEEIFVKDNATLNEKNYDIFLFLITSITINAESSVLELQNEVNKHGSSLEISTLAIETDSLLSETQRKYKKIISDSIVTKNISLFTRAEQEIAAIQTSLKPLLQDLQVDQEPEVIIQTQIEYREVQAPLPPAQASNEQETETLNTAPAVCPSAGATCRTDNDCCADQGYTCTIQRTVRGAEVQRCLKL